MEQWNAESTLRRKAAKFFEKSDLTGFQNL
jgi:hypothetical protein